MVPWPHFQSTAINNLTSSFRDQVSFYIIIQRINTILKSTHWSVI